MMEFGRMHWTCKWSLDCQQKHSIPILPKYFRISFLSSSGISFAERRFDTDKLHNSASWSKWTALCLFYGVGWAGVAAGDIALVKATGGQFCSRPRLCDLSYL